MVELTAGNALAYLRDSHGYNTTSARVTALGGGVSNGVFLVETGSERLVLKQALEKLRVEADWRSDRERAFRESLALERLAPLLPAGAVPGVLFEDRPNFLFAMTAAPPEAETWKALLLGGDGIAGMGGKETAERIARLHGALLRAGVEQPWAEAFGDQTVFDQLRLDPYYRTTAARHAGLAGHFERAIRACRERTCTLVHGDWSPKNFLVTRGQVMLIDFEVIHYGDPAFDAAFLLNHLLLKSFYRPALAEAYGELARAYWTTLAGELPAGFAWLERGTLEHLGCLLMARIDGKSPVEYLTDEETRQRVRDFARTLLLEPAESAAEVFERLAEGRR